MSSPGSSFAPEPSDQREGGDRRRRSPLLADWRWAFRGRRREIRRASDQGRVQLDWIDPKLLIVSFGILVLSGLDAALTLDLLQAGVVVEANPLMKVLVHQDIQLFVNLKILITGAAVVILVACYQTTLLRLVTVRRVLEGVFLLYLGLVGYELYLMRLGGQLFR